MFSANPAKRPRRETIADTLSSVGNLIAQALQPGAAPVQQVWMILLNNIVIGNILINMILILSLQINL